jgi:hypothetical protein
LTQLRLLGLLDLSSEKATWLRLSCIDMFVRVDATADVFLVLTLMSVVNGRVELAAQA